MEFPKGYSEQPLRPHSSIMAPVTSHPLTLTGILPGLVSSNFYRPDVLSVAQSTVKALKSKKNMKTKNKK